MTGDADREQTIFRRVGWRRTTDSHMPDRVLRSTAVAIVIRLLQRRRERRRLAVIRARHALVSLPTVCWRDDSSEYLARVRLQEITATVDRALRLLHGSSDSTLALKYADARLTGFLQGWNDPELIAPNELPEMYQGLIAALHSLALRLAAEKDGCRHAHITLLTGPRASTASNRQIRGARGVPAIPIPNQPGDHGQSVTHASYCRSSSHGNFRGRIR
ncbi:hypothetical protein M8542_36470 [Amycolatopsis sp. OK19-0408]|uniref:Uncharacterized protein n=1 Tax=Amycolatopsis iheyensis TaxID=2945988 RepID=A0A9X2NNK1_9PSEU|nr:hypothetical protein [Amycolatopsis iheyensis]MCR6488340.1 hypothetical protein [Amycolatopsis iheyensis]